jgi:circadian clock protein KaiC
MGPAGGGKSLLALQFVRESINRGNKAAMFVFDEELGLLFDRAKPLGFDLPAMQASGKLLIKQLDAAELSTPPCRRRIRWS